MQTIRYQAFRAGSLDKTCVYGETALLPDGQQTTLFAYADARRPAGRTGRLHGLFCSPTVGELQIWTRAHNSSKWRLDCVGPEPYVYDVEVWSRAEDEWRLFTDGDQRADQGASVNRWIDQYWREGMPLSHWLEGPKPCWYAAELLVPPAEIVHAAELQAHAEPVDWFARLNAHLAADTLAY